MGDGPSTAPSGIVVRDAVAADLPAITGLFNALIETTTGAWRETLADADEMAAWWEAQQAAGHPVLVAEAEAEVEVQAEPDGAAEPDGDARVVGYVTWGRFRHYPGYLHTVELTIHVDGDHHGGGVGRALMGALVDRARAAEVHVLVAGIDGDNEGSLAFHRSLGFTEVGRMPEVGTKFGRWLTLVLMQRVLDEADPSSDLTPSAGGRPGGTAG